MSTVLLPKLLTREILPMKSVRVSLAELEIHDLAGDTHQYTAQDKFHYGGPHIPVRVLYPTGFINPLVQSGSSIPEPIEGVAIIDSGASCSAIAPYVREALRLPEVKLNEPVAEGKEDYKEAEGVAFGIQVDSLDLFVQINDGSIFKNLSEPVVAIIGRDILKHCILMLDGPHGSYTIVYKVTPAHKPGELRVDDEINPSTELTTL